MARSESSLRTPPRWWVTTWSVLTVVTFTGGLLCNWRLEGFINTIGPVLLIQLVATGFSWSIMRALEQDFPWRLAGWIAIASLSAVSAAGLVKQVGWPSLVLVAALAVSSPPVLGLASSRWMSRQPVALVKAVAPPGNSIHMSQTEVDRRFDAIVSRL